MEYNEYKDIVEEVISGYLNGSSGDQRITSAMRYVLTGGKRLRPVLTLAILQRLIGDKWRDYERLALVPEFIHTASLIIDDLPAFDDAEVRRGQRCIHLVRGEGIAYLLSLGLVTDALGIIHKQLPSLKKRYELSEVYQRYETQIQNIMENLSGGKALGGQLLSTFHTSGETNLKDAHADALRELSGDEILDIVYKKTAPFFEIALVLGWVFGGGDPGELDTIKRLAGCLGICYQIYDDFMDLEEDSEISHNYVHHRGKEAALADYIRYRDEVKEIVDAVGLDCPAISYITNLMNTRIEYYYE
jgi:geranylgeranyl diphosphate synthase type II